MPDAGESEAPGNFVWYNLTEDLSHGDRPAMTAQDIYSATVTALPPAEQLRLASLILNGLSGSNEAIDYSDSWSDEDLQDLTAFSVKHAGKTIDKR